MGNFDKSSWFYSIFKMDITISLAMLLAVIALGTPVSTSEPRVVCYYTNWSVYRPGTAKFNPQNINPYLCTHLIYAFGGFTKDNTLKPFDKYQDIEKGGYAKFTGLKTYNKELKTLLAIGGWNEGSSRFSPMVASRERRKEFVRNAIKFLRQNRFDGLDLDWEYPAFRDGGKSKDRENYAKLVRELREEFERESQKTGKPRLLLTMAVPAGIEYIEKGFDVRTLNEYLDWMNLLTYDYHSAFEPAVNHHAPLYPLEEPNEYSVDNELNIDYTIKFYLENGADADKLVLGIPTYGRSYTLFNPDANEIGSPADGPGEQGEATREKGYLAYYEICEALMPKEKKRRQTSEEDSDEDTDDEDEEPNWSVMYPNPDAMGPVAYKGNQWVGYDDVEIVKKKANYVAENGLGGIMFWSIDNDDFRGVCHEKPYPLIEAAKEAYFETLASSTKKTKTSVARPTSNRKKSRPRSTTTTTTTERTTKVAKRTSTTPAWNITPEPPATPDPGTDFKCVDEGFYPHPRDCKKYFWCLDSGPSNLGIVAHQFTCPSGLYFNKAADSCDFARNVPCKKSSPTTKAPITKSPTTRTTSTTTTTTRRPIRLSTKSTSLFRTTNTRSTTTPEPEPEEEEDDLTDEDAEDPKVIKELIDLIKKVGGIEQLEKQLGLGEQTVSTNGAVTTTASSFNKKLYQKVLERTKGRNKYTSNSISENAAQNSRSGPQNAGLDSTNDRDKLLRRDRPQYTTINRQRASSSTTEEPLEAEQTEEEIETEEEEIPAFRFKSSEGRTKVATTAKPLQYVNIRRGKPASVTLDTADNSDSRNALFDRTEALIAVSDTPDSLDVVNLRRENLPEYVTIRRQRPTTEETTTAQYQNPADEEEIKETALEKEISTQPQYSTIVRSRSTVSPEEISNVTSLNRVRSTTLPTETSSSDLDPTTILAVQISSFLNSPNSSDIEFSETEPPVTTEAANPPTTISSTTTTTSTTTPAASTRRINLIRRRGSTTTSAPVPSTTTQVSSRNYTSVKRRRPLPRQNEITSDSGDSNNLSRKIRSTTPDSREVDKVTQTRSRPRTRYSRFQASQTRSDDSIPAEASPILKEQTRFHDTTDEVSPLNPIEATPQFASKQVSRFQRRFRKPVVSSSDLVPDSEVSAATVEARRPNLLSRGRNKFTLASIINTTGESVTTVSLTQRRPTYARFTPRPFTQLTTVDVNEDTPIEVAIQRNVPRLPFGRTGAPPAIEARKLPFPSRFSTTQQTLTSDDDDNVDYSEIRSDDILLSESAREENEHIEPEITTEVDILKRRVVIKKLRPPGTADGELVSTEMIPIDESGKKRFRVIRRRPTTAITLETIAPTEIPTGPGPQRIRKIIRKKIIPAEHEPEIPAKPLGSLNNLRSSTKSFNYGEKTRTPTTTITTQTETEPIIEEVTEFLKEEKKIKPITQIENIDTNTEFVDEEQVTEKIIGATEEKQGDKFTIDLTAISSSAEMESSIMSDNLNNVEIKSNSVKDVGFQQNNTLQMSNTELKTKDFGDTSNVNEGNKSDSDIDSETEDNVEVVIGNQEVVLDISSENDNIPELEPTVTETEIPQTTAIPTTLTTASTMTSTPSPVRTRLPYRPRKKLFSPSTEPSLPSTSKIFSRKYNPGAYTSPASPAEKPQFRPSGIVTRRPFSSKIFTRRPFTPRTTQKVEDDYIDLEVLEESDEPEQDNPFVFVPANQLFTRKPGLNEDDEEVVNSDEILDEGDENYEEEEHIDDVTPKFSLTTRKPGFKPRLVNSNTFRTSTTTTELPKLSGSSQNRTGIITRFSSNKPISDGKKRVQNVPPGYNSPINSLRPNLVSDIVKNETLVSEKSEDKETTISSEIDIEAITADDDYLTETSTIVTDNKDIVTTDDVSTTNTFEPATSTDEIQLDDSTDDYLEFTEVTTNYPTTNYEDTSKTTNLNNILTGTMSDKEATTEQLTTTMTTTTISPPVSPFIKTQFDKLFSVSRVVEINSKSEKHRLNKNNETTLIEKGNIVVEKSPVVDKIGEVSRYSFIKIVEDEIPIYLTKLGHVYPVENPPDNVIRIDEARNARALNENFSDIPRENLVASESINEGYRHVNQDSKDHENTGHVEHIASDEFLSYVNHDKKVDKDQDDTQYTQWRFVPAAYENEKAKADKSFEIVTPRTMHTKQSTLPLEGLFENDDPTMAQKVNNEENQPFVVYSGTAPSQEESGNIVPLSVMKPETVSSITTFAKGQEFKSDSTIEEALKAPVKISVLPQLDVNSMLPISSVTSGSITSSIASAILTEKITSPIIDLLSTTPAAKEDTLITSTFTTSTTTTTTTREASTTTTVTPEESTTIKISPVDAKRAKFGFPRRPIIKSSNFTRPPLVFRSTKKINSTVKSNLSQKSNKTFTPTKSRFSINRVQNVPVDSRKKTNGTNLISKNFTTTKTYTTESPKTTTEKKLYFKPIRPSFRPSFLQRKTTPVTYGDT